jgi:hypothetical protein
MPGASVPQWRCRLTQGSPVRPPCAGELSVGAAARKLYDSRTRLLKKNFAKGQRACSDHFKRVIDTPYPPQTKSASTSAARLSRRAGQVARRAQRQGHKVTRGPDQVPAEVTEPSS